MMINMNYIKMNSEQQRPTDQLVFIELGSGYNFVFEPLKIEEATNHAQYSLITKFDPSRIQTLTTSDK